MGIPVESVVCGDADVILWEVGVAGEGTGAAVLVAVGPVLKGMLVMDGLCTVGPPKLGAETGAKELVGEPAGDNVAGDDETGEPGDGLRESTGLAGACDASPDTGADGEFGAVLTGAPETGLPLAVGRIESGLVAGAMAVVGAEAGCCDADGATRGLETGPALAVGASAGADGAEGRTNTGDELVGEAIAGCELLGDDSGGVALTGVEVTGGITTGKRVAGTIVGARDSGG